MFNIDLFICELPMLGGLCAIVFILVSIFAAVAVIQTGGNLRFVAVALALVAMVGIIGVVCLAFEAWEPTRTIADDYVNYFNFSPTFWGRMGVIAVISVPAMIVAIPFFWMESKLLNWAARG